MTLNYNFPKFACPGANVAQLVEQLTRNEQAAGSNPAVGSKKNKGNSFSPLQKSLIITKKINWVIQFADEDETECKYRGYITRYPTPPGL